MKYPFWILLFLLGAASTFAQTKYPHYYVQKKSFNDSLKAIIHDANLDGTYDTGEDGMQQVSFAVIDLTGSKPLLGGVNMDRFIYPASVYKMYVAMEILRQISNNQYSLFRNYVIKHPNDVDKTSEISWDPRPLLKDGDTVTVNYLLDLMVTRSDNSAANCLIDIADRKNINKTMHENGWFGSEVTRKYLSRKVEDAGYDTVRSTVTSALHAADFMYKVYSDQLINPWVSQQMKVLLGRQLDTTKLSTGFPHSAMFYHKTGWWNYFTNDVGIVEDGHIKFVISLFTPITENDVRARFTLVADRVYRLIKNMHQK